MDCPFSCQRYAQFAVDLPYPQVRVTKPNRRWATVVSGAFAGKGSEATAIAQYGVHRFHLTAYPEASEAYIYIASVEMIHWHLLGSLIRDLGINPRLFSCETGAWWSGSFPEYAQSFGDIIAADIRGEQGAIAHYRRMIAAIGDADIQALFRRIILDEEKHIEILKSLYARYA